MQQPPLEGDQRKVMPGQARDGQVEDVHPEAEGRFEPRHEIRFQLAARDRERVGHDDVRGRRHAPHNARDERAVTGVGRNTRRVALKRVTRIHILNRIPHLNPVQP